MSVFILKITFGIAHRLKITSEIAVRPKSIETAPKLYRDRKEGANDMMINMMNHSVSTLATTVSSSPVVRLTDISVVTSALTSTPDIAL